MSEGRNKWSDEQLQSAIEAVRNGQMKPHRAAVTYGIPPSTLYDHLKGKSKKRYGGKPTVLSNEEEKEIATVCEVLQQFGYPLTREIVGGIVKEYLLDRERPNPFRNSVPGPDWWRGYLKRWPNLAERKPQHLPKCRAQGARPEVTT